ncbi:hypothetical protein CAOG_02874 [Capsaspora owczarzaki ATCC 30864]|uniref:Uncharacterized protein n=1 Tax=Capsaspora owczarzaki (strain ATCC 30864) TaxID=595528 RepID=A0A0D2WM21_CAPO3|nr:hypothetical protein CAOG_02874 [Capsaspora owczarzaki ATCC 30864]KJE91790.1 hypothetical protein CAOG_002874 [Capsaspora owczarzaki ATCC 30864]|eukprot:XP_004363713.1 hypothetical protein CAOG_02874 [Capsaspora owczarzaki ATCC 30864]
MLKDIKRPGSSAPVKSQPSSSSARGLFDQVVQRHSAQSSLEASESSSPTELAWVTADDFVHLHQHAWSSSDVYAALGQAKAQQLAQAIFDGDVTVVRQALRSGLRAMLCDRLSKSDRGGNPTPPPQAAASSSSASSSVDSPGAKYHPMSEQLLAALNSVGATLIDHHQAISSKAMAGWREIRRGDQSSSEQMLAPYASPLTPMLHLAPTLEMVSLLLEHGANPNEQDSLGHTALFYAPSNAAVITLVEHGANVDHRAADKSTPGLFALLRDPACVKGLLAALLESGADISLSFRIPEQRSLVDLAWMTSAWRFACMLLAHGAVLSREMHSRFEPCFSPLTRLALCAARGDMCSLVAIVLPPGTHYEPNEASEKTPSESEVTLESVFSRSSSSQPSFRLQPPTTEDLHKLYQVPKLSVTSSRLTSFQVDSQTSVLMLACMAEQLELVNLLLTVHKMNPLEVFCASSSPSAQASCVTALEVAAETGNAQLLRMIVAHVPKDEEHTRMLKQRASRGALLALMGGQHETATILMELADNVDRQTVLAASLAPNPKESIAMAIDFVEKFLGRAHMLEQCNYALRYWVHTTRPKMVVLRLLLFDFGVSPSYIPTGSTTSLLHDIVERNNVAMLRILIAAPNANPDQPTTHPAPPPVTIGRAVESFGTRLLRWIGQHVRLPVLWLVAVLTRQRHRRT